MCFFSKLRWKYWLWPKSAFCFEKNRKEKATRQKFCNMHRPPHQIEFQHWTAEIHFLSSDQTTLHSKNISSKFCISYCKIYSYSDEIYNLQLKQKSLQIKIRRIRNKMEINSAKTYVNYCRLFSTGDCRLSAALLLFLYASAWVLANLRLSCNFPPRTPSSLYFLKVPFDDLNSRFKASSPIVSMARCSGSRLFWIALRINSPITLSSCKLWTKNKWNS